jgi:hypothetical protein
VVLSFIVTFEDTSFQVPTRELPWAKEIVVVTKSRDSRKLLRFMFMLFVVMNGCVAFTKHGSTFRWRRFIEVNPFI